MLKRISLILLLTLPAFLLPASGQGVVSASTRWATVTFEVGDVYYTELGGDGIENDVVAEFVLTIVNNKRFYSLISVEIELPSGTTYIFFFTMSNMKSGEYIGDFRIHNVAYEKGWYTFSLGILLYGGNFDGDHMSVVFDPPEEKKGGNPFAEFNTGG